MRLTTYIVAAITVCAGLLTAWLGQSLYYRGLGLALLTITIGVITIHAST